MNSITVEASIDYLDTVLDFINGELERICCPKKEQMQIAIAVEEIYVNIAYYAYTPKAGQATVCCEVQKDSPSVIIRFLDQGRPYNPLEKAEPDILLSAEERELGGLGILMVKKSMDYISYEFEDGYNILTIGKRV